MLNRLSYLPVPFFFALFGFFIGNLLPSSFVFFPEFFTWKHGVGFLLILLNEGLAFSIFRIRKMILSQTLSQGLRNSIQFLSSSIPKQSIFLPSKQRLKSLQFTIWLFSFRCFKFGIFFGLFVDAFKVGS